MTKEGWREAIVRAHVDPTLLELMAQLLYEQDEARRRLHDLGYGWIGLSWSGIVDEIKRQHGH